jgi:hypothetical protein
MLAAHETIETLKCKGTHNEVGGEVLHVEKEDEKKINEEA